MADSSAFLLRVLLVPELSSSASGVRSILLRCADSFSKCSSNLIRRPGQLLLSEDIDTIFSRAFLTNAAFKIRQIAIWVKAVKFLGLSEPIGCCA